jgi:two-component system, NarL family, sensor histidine kinase UhpB
VTSEAARTLLDFSRFCPCSSKAGEESSFETQGEWVSELQENTDRTGESAVREDSELSRHLLRAQEEERKRISRELHDETGQGLMLLRLQLSILATEAQSGDWEKRVKEATTLLDQTISGLRRIIGRLSPRALENLGLAGAIRKEARDLSKNTDIGTRLSVPEQFGDLDPEVEIAVYRCVQEALHNVAKHSRARNVTIELHQRGQKLALVIEDDGIGISRATRARSKGFGLVGMRERVAVLGGRVRIGRSKEGGTRLRITLPTAFALEALNQRPGVSKALMRQQTMRQAS